VRGPELQLAAKDLAKTEGQGSALKAQAAAELELAARTEARKAQGATEDSERELSQAQALGLQHGQEPAEEWDLDSALAAGREWDPAGAWGAGTDRIWAADPGEVLGQGAEQDSDRETAAGVRKERGAAPGNRQTKRFMRSYTR